jgi:starch-binding outer membrane protein, SusD/RagB family
MINNYFLTGITSLFLSVAFVGCTKTVESGPLETLPLNLVFDNQDSLGVNAQQFLYNIYANLPKGYNRVDNNVLDAGSDDAVPSTINQSVEDFSTGKIQPSVLPDNAWNAEYAGIRKVNLFLANIGVVPLNLPGQKAQWISEARILRAVFYFELVKRWGGVPIIHDTIFNLGDNAKYKRNTFDECVQYISNEVDSAVSALPAVYSGSYFGRITRGAALALKSRLLLYAASPLNNPTNDQNKWIAAATAAQTVMSTGTYSLVSSFSNVFSTRSNTEVIMAYYNSTGYSVEQMNGPVGSVRGDLGFTSPTQELVDEYETKSGLMISDPASGYDPQNPYANRDPRLALTVFYNGQSWLGRTVQTYDGGVDRPAGYGNATSGETRTGYYMRKFLSTAGSNSAYANAEHDFPIFRYAEILLNYAEASNEAYGPSAQVYSAVQSIRQRAGLSPYALPAGLTQDQMRTRIRHERRVEMAFEEQRFWDIRRWKIADLLLNGNLHGVQITNSNGSFSYQTVPVSKTLFDATRMYLYPIPFQEVVASPNMAQNPNW